MRGAAARQSGVTLIEILVTLLIGAFGLLALAGFIGRASALGVESNQRARASAILLDMADRMRNNKGNEPAYVSAATLGAAVEDCDGLAAGAPLDLCEWNNLLAGANEAPPDGTVQILGFVGCIRQPTAGLAVYTVTVAWGAAVPGAVPADDCGAGIVNNDETLRRTLRAQVRPAVLGAPAP